ncbi:MAG: bifunctional hydroxymethylpyrimidine kinase/phosphomethylpyrimidine kinase [Desulfurococcaceae archaeon]
MASRVPVAMTIAGSDSGGGAGIEADLKTFSALGVHGTAAITSITAQNTLRVTAIYDIPGWMVYEQIKVVHEDIGIDAAKTGMLSNSEIIKAVADAVKEFNLKLVVDPVMVAKSGARLLREDAVEALKKNLLPLALVVTPNAPEASILAGFKVETVEDAVKAAKKIHELYGVEAVVVKGGHLSDPEVVDVLYFNGEYYYLKSKRYPRGCFHGAGCTYSAAITAFIAKGYSIVKAVEEAKKFIDTAIYYGLRIGRGHCPVNPLAYIEIPALKYTAIENVRKAVEILLENQAKIIPYAPEVGINVVEAIDARYVESPLDVVGVEGRLVKAGNKLIKVGEIKAGASSHLARLVIALIRNGLDVRAAVNIKYNPVIVNKAVENGLNVVFVDRTLEPEDLKKAEMGTMEWIASQIPPGSKEPDLIYDKGDIGKEAMIRIIGKNAVDAVNKLLRLLT